MKKHTALLILALTGITTTGMSYAEALRLPRIFSDHMVLQRDAKIRFWGWAKPGAAITVDIGGTTAKAKAAADGAWEIMLPARTAGGPHEVTISSDDGGRLRLKDVYFGDVWLASGQSNMEWKIGWPILNQANEIKDSRYPLIRFFEVPNAVSHAPAADVGGGQWMMASPETVGNFSAAAWFFAKHNHKEKNVPVGVIDSTWGGTPAEAWVDARQLLGFDEYKDQARQVLDPAVDWKAALAANESNEKIKQDLVGNQQRVLDLKIHEMNYKDSKWQTVRLPNDKPMQNFVWLRKSFQWSGDPGQPARLRFGDLVQNAMIFVNGKLIAEENWLTDGSAYDLPAGTLRKGRNMIALRVANDWNNEVYAGKPGQMKLEIGADEINLEGEWRYNNTLEPEMPLVLRYSSTPGFLYNAMIHPLAGYRLRGAIWYQGESNTHQPQVYASLFKTLITDWRAKWQQGDFPFLFVQLAGYRDRDHGAGWPLLREAQTAALALPATGMAVTMDIGDADDIHPRNKQDVGRRLWLNARKIAFGEDLLHSGPIYKSHQIKGDHIILKFDHVGKAFLGPNSQQIPGFTIAGADRQFYPAQTQWKGDTITVSNADVPSPVAVRYAWEDYFKVELFNWAWLPMSPFRTDNWEK